MFIAIYFDEEVRPITIYYTVRKRINYVRI